MQWPRRSAVVPHPTTGDMTPVWTRRQAAQVLHVDRAWLQSLEQVGYIPGPIYGTRSGSPLWSMRQIALIASLMKWVRAHRREPSGFTETWVSRQATKLRKEWDDGLCERNGNGNHRNARWRTRRQVVGG